MITFSCECGKRYQVKDEMAGKRGKCTCGKMLVIPPPIALAQVAAQPATVKPEAVLSPIDEHRRPRRPSIRWALLAGIAATLVIISVAIWSFNGSEERAANRVPTVEVGSAQQQEFEQTAGQSAEQAEREEGSTGAATPSEEVQQIEPTTGLDEISRATEKEKSVPDVAGIGREATISAEKLESNQAPAPAFSGIWYKQSEDTQVVFHKDGGVSGIASGDRQLAWRMEGSHIAIGGGLLVATHTDKGILELKPSAAVLPFGAQPEPTYLVRDNGWKYSEIAGEWQDAEKQVSLQIGGEPPISPAQLVSDSRLTGTDGKGETLHEASIVGRTPKGFAMGFHGRGWDAVLSDDGKTMTLQSTDSKPQIVLKLTKTNGAPDKESQADSSSETLDPKEVAKAKTFDVEKKPYFIWRDDKGRVKSSKIGGLSPVEEPWLPIGFDFLLSPSAKSEPVCKRMKIVATSKVTGELMELTTYLDDESMSGKSEGKTAAIFLPTQYKITGEGEALIDLIRIADKGKSNAESISNTLKVLFLIEE